MSDPVIKVENLGKKYIIGHQKQEKYTALRDVISNSVRSILSPKTKANNNREEFWALKDINFEINQGDRVGIIGRNGAGKSTLLKVLSRITEPTIGSIKIRGRVASLLEVGTGFHPELTGRENIFLNGAILGMGKQEITKKFDEIVTFAEVEKFLDTPVKRYSSGMYVRLAFAVAAHLEPEILIVDEVLAVGDAQFQKKCLGKMEDVGKEGRTVLFVSHNIAAVKKLCSTGILLNSGKIQSVNDIDTVLQQYQDNINSFGDDKNVSIKKQYHEDIKIDFFDIEKISVLNKEYEPVDVFHTGESLVIQINFNSLSRIVSPSFIISCKSQTGFELFQLCTSPISGYTLNEIDTGRGCIQLYIDSLNLLGGIYYFDLSLAMSGIKRYFTIEQAIKLNIESTDVYNSGFTLDQRYGVLSVNHCWKYSQSNKTTVSSSSYTN